ncbi:MAG: MFS transporter [Rhabdochlamydiaceae bacterium]|nr:MFS transporter [Candidatus Amphrikana amoebophyrae]
MRRMFILYVVIFAAFLGISMSILSFTSMTLNLEESILPRNTTLSMRTAILGVMVGMYPLGQFFGAPILGALSDNYGRRRMLLISLVSTTCTYMVVALSIFPFNLHLLAVSLFITGFFEGNVVIAQSSIADLCPAEKRTTAFGYVSVAASGAFVIGPLLGPILTNHHIVSWFNFSTPFWVASIFFVCLTLWIYFRFHETLPEERREKKPMFQSFINLKEIFIDKQVRRFYGVNILLYMGVFGFFRLFPQFMVNNYSISHSTLCFSMVNLDLPIIIISLFFIKPIVNRFSLIGIMRMGALILALGITLIIGLNSFLSTWFTIYFAAIGIAYIMPTTTSLISSQVHIQKQGSVLGNNTSLVILAQLTAVLISIGFTHINIRIPLSIAIVMLIIATFLTKLIKLNKTTSI